MQKINIEVDCRDLMQLYRKDLNIENIVKSKVKERCIKSVQDRVSTYTNFARQALPMSPYREMGDIIIKL